MWVELLVRHPYDWSEVPGRVLVGEIVSLALWWVERDMKAVEAIEVTLRCGKQLVVYGPSYAELVRLTNLALSAPNV